MMQPLDLNLASRPFRNNTLIWAGCSLALGLLLAFTAWNGITYNEIQSSLSLIQYRIETFDREFEDLGRRQVEADRAVKKIDVDALSVQARMTNDVIDRKAFSWTRLFNQMENAQPWNVRMNSVRRVQRERRGRRAAIEVVTESGFPISVEGTSKDLEALLEFERRLFSDDHFDHPEPERHERLDSGEIGFQMRFVYYPEGQTGELDAAVEPDAVEAVEVVDADVELVDEPAPAEAEPVASEPLPTPEGE